MKSLLAFALFAVGLQACGSRPMVDAVQFDENEPAIGSLVAVSTEVTTATNADNDSELGLIKSVATALSGLSGAAAVSGKVDVKATGAATPAAQIDVSAVTSVAAASTEIPTSARVTFTLKSAAGAASAASEKLVLEQEFPKDVGAAAINKKSELKLQHGKTYSVLIEQLKADKVLQTTEVTFHFRKKGSGAIKLATSQRSGVSLRYGKGDENVLRECPAGKFMSGIGFNEIPICRVSAPAASASASGSSAGSNPAPQQPAPQPAPVSTAQDPGTPVASK
ncbi:MAG: hypothetical protein ACO3A4_14010 [Silvanigrellaceae bacterium]